MLSLVGSFLLVPPVAKYSSKALGLRLFLLVLQMMSALHLLNIFPLLTQRSAKPFTSRIWRRIFANIPFFEYAILALLMIVFTLPFSAAASKELNTDFTEELLAFLTGGFFRSQVTSSF